MGESDWLKKRLSPAKRDEPRWIELAEALQSMWETYFDPAYSAMLDMRSIYTASPNDLKRRIREMGEYFSPDYPTEFDQPLAVAWRKSELERKSTEYILSSTFKRNFSGLAIDWVPLYAKKSEPYGAAWYQESEIEGDASSYYLTSRGKVRVDLAIIYTEKDYTKGEFKAVVDRLVRRLKPLHIVYQGLHFTATVNVPTVYFSASGGYSRREAEGHAQFLSSSLHFDDIAADVRQLDYMSPISASSSNDRTVLIPALNKSLVVFDETPADLVPLDTEHNIITYRA